jgi:TIR domain
MARDVFISHAHKDERIAGAVWQKLESAGVGCWIAPRNVAAGEDWTKAIRNAFAASRVTVLVFSENANAAAHIAIEIANAFYTGRIIIPFRLTKALPRRNLPHPRFWIKQPSVTTVYLHVMNGFGDSLGLARVDLKLSRKLTLFCLI